jgi:hypothetical protein
MEERRRQSGYHDQTSGRDAANRQLANTIYGKSKCVAWDAYFGYQHWSIQATFRKNIYTTLEGLQSDLDAWIESYNHERTHQGKMCCGRTPMATFEDGKTICREESLNLN